MIAQNRHYLGKAAWLTDFEVRLRAASAIPIGLLFRHN
jgi:hypothetical protein